MAAASHFPARALARAMEHIVGRNMNKWDIARCRPISHDAGCFDVHAHGKLRLVLSFLNRNIGAAKYVCLDDQHARKMVSMTLLWPLM